MKVVADGTAVGARGFCVKAPIKGAFHCRRLVAKITLHYLLRTMF